jgi:hypothetical protein
MDAIGAAIDLQGAPLDQIDQRMVEPALRTRFSSATNAFIASGATL